MVVSACERAEREFFSDFAGRWAAPPQTGKTLWAKSRQAVILSEATNLAGLQK
jgi:hypothetical protein